MWHQIAQTDRNPLYSATDTLLSSSSQWRLAVCVLRICVRDARQGSTYSLYTHCFACDSTRACQLESGTILMYVADALVGYSLLRQTLRCRRGLWFCCNKVITSDEDVLFVQCYSIKFQLECISSCVCKIFPSPVDTDKRFKKFVVLQFEDGGWSQLRFQFKWIPYITPGYTSTSQKVKAASASGE